jgi:diaminobutyrate-2-oxoglutarate transaminase
METFERLESQVRGYCRSFPAVFDRAQGCRLFDEEGRAYVDFFSGAGALNYGHNPPRLKHRLIEYLERDGVTHTLDMATAAKREFLERFESVILRPRGLAYKLQFPGPTGTNAVEAALKLARKVTGRESVVSFTNAFHGMTLGALSVTGNAFKRRGAGVPLVHCDTMPFDGYLGPNIDTLDYLEAFLDDDGSGVDCPAAVILETVQAEGGIHVASDAWLRRLARICRDREIVLVVDDIQVGCGRTGPFFSFERAGIEPDIVCLSKSLSGYGLPLALVLIRPDLDIWEPGEHNGTFRGHNPAFVTATAALDFWETDELSKEVERKGEIVSEALEEMAARYPSLAAHVRGRGLLRGLDCPGDGVAAAICRRAFEAGLVLETSGPDGHVVKLMPPLVIDEVALKEGLGILAVSAAAVAERLAAPAGPEAAAGDPSLRHAKGAA